MRLRKCFLELLLAVVTLLLPVQAHAAWSAAQAENLLGWIERAQDEGIVLPSENGARIRAAIDTGDNVQLDAAANEAAVVLLRAWRGRCCGEGRPAWWHIDGGMSDAELLNGLTMALNDNRLDLYLRSIRPSNPHYSLLAEALATETNSARRGILKLNLTRWRMLPADLGERYLLVNIASQQLTLWEQGEIKGRWRVIIGKPVTRTPVFTTRVTGVVINPWWEIPSSIAAEGIASFVRRNPSAARSRGYIYQNGRFRQMPGDNNALGRMKLVMPNPYSVFLHDTSNRELFQEERRAFSHGCVRVDRALSFAATLLARDGWDLAAIEQAVETGKTRTIPLTASIPLYVTYFTAEVAPSGEIRFLEDIYRRDPVFLAARPALQPSGSFQRTSFVPASMRAAAVSSPENTPCPM